MSQILTDRVKVFLLIIPINLNFENKIEPPRYHQLEEEEESSEL